MQFNIENQPQSLSDLVFADKETEEQFMFRATAKTAGNILLYGPHGSGKSQALKVLAKTLHTSDYETDTKTINVSKTTSKAALCSEIEGFGGFALFNPLGRAIIILEEIDGADKAAQKALKGVLEDMQGRAIFFATTNDLDSVIEPIQDRFTTIYFPHPPADAWANRAVQILRKAGVNVPHETAVDVIRTYARGGSARAVLDGLERYAHDVWQTSSSAKGGAA